MPEKESSVPSSASLQTFMRIAAWAGLICLLIPAILLRQSNLFICVLAMIPVAIMLLALAWILKYLELQSRQTETMHATLSRLEKGLTEKPAATHHAPETPSDPKAPASVTATASAPSPQDPPAPRIPEGYPIMPDVYPLLDALHELRDILLMSDEQRAGVRRQRDQQSREQLLASIRISLEQQQLDLAAHRLETLPPEDPARSEFEREIAYLREEQRKRGVAEAREKLHHLPVSG